jgi:hypothetical protein
MANVQFDFEISLEIANKNYADISYCCFLRAPLVKQSGIIIVKTYLSQLIIRQMMADIDRNEFTKIKLRIFKKDEQSKKRTQEIFQQEVNCINVVPEGPIRYQEERMHVQLVLVHWILQYLSNNNTYNIIEEETTSYSALTNYESWLNTTFNNIFTPNHIGVDINSHSYEQILIRSPNDLNVPTFLINSYKPSNHFGFYFFDPFYISTERKTDITNHFLCFKNKNDFKKIDVYEYVDRKLNVDFIKIRNMPDLKEKFLTPRGNRIIYTHQEIKFDHAKDPTNCDLPYEITNGLVDIPLVGDRNIKNIPDIKRSTKQNISSAITSIYSPDDISFSSIRYDNCKELMENIKGIQYYEMANCLPDFPQFGEIYNLEEENRTNYILTPINITNIFVRKNVKENSLYHLAKTVMIRFKND